MPYKEGQPTLMGFLGSGLVARVARKLPFGKPFIRLSNFCEVLWFLYESGAILGRARRNKLDILEKILVSSVFISEYGSLMSFQSKIQRIQFLRKLAQKRLDTFKNEIGKEPDTFIEFILYREFEKRAWIRLTGSLEAYIGGDKKILKAFEKKIPLILAYPDIEGFGLEGIGFGASFPELTERMYRNAYEGIDTDIWSEARAHGLPIPQKPAIVGLEEREETVLQMVAAYASEYYPELLDPLDLRVPDL